MARVVAQVGSPSSPTGHAIAPRSGRPHAGTWRTWVWRHRSSTANELGFGRIMLEASGFAAAAFLTVWSAMVIKQAGQVPTLMAVATTPAARVMSTESIDGGLPIVDPLVKGHEAEPSREAAPLPLAVQEEGVGTAEVSGDAADGQVRWFNGRPIRPAHVMWMTVTAYTPGAESCWPSDDGETATLHCVTTNGGAMVAADTRVLPFGSLVSVAGYDDSRVVPVLDRGGKIRGQRLDVLMETVPEARAWGVRRVPVVVWEYADGLGTTDPRRVR